MKSGQVPWRRTFRFGLCRLISSSWWMSARSTGHFERESQAAIRMNIHVLYSGNRFISSASIGSVYCSFRAKSAKQIPRSWRPGANFGSSISSPWLVNTWQTLPISLPIYQNAFWSSSAKDPFPEIATAPVFAVSPVEIFAIICGEAAKFSKWLSVDRIGGNACVHKGKHIDLQLSNASRIELHETG
jgi:hypothetical protein